MLSCLTLGQIVGRTVARPNMHSAPHHPVPYANPNLIRFAGIVRPTKKTFQLDQLGPKRIDLTPTGLLEGYYTRGSIHFYSDHASLLLPGAGRGRGVAMGGG